MLAAFVGTGIFLSVRTRFFQFTHIGTWMRETLFATVKSKEVRTSGDSGSLSQLQTLCSALAACLGTGNIVGVATALSAGGAGALLWMLVCAVPGMMTCCAENVLGLRYRERNKNGEWTGGAMLCLSRGLGLKKAAKLYAFLLAAVSLGMGCTAQANSMALALSGSFGIPTFVTGAVAAALCGFVIFGGIKRLGALTEKLIPAATLLFVAMSAAAIFVNWERLFPALAEIVSGAFSPAAAAGGAAGSMMSRAARYGVARGVFSNEAGLGSCAVIHCACDNDKPAVQGMWGIFEVFVDTIIMCTLTGLVILTSDAWLVGESDGALLSAAAFGGAFGRAGEIFVTLSIVLFAFATLSGWSYCGVKGTEYLFGLRSEKPFKAIFSAAVFVGSVMSLETVWNVSDILNALMALPNLLAVLLLSGEVSREMKKT